MKLSYQSALPLVLLSLTIATAACSDTADGNTDNDSETGGFTGTGATGSATGGSGGLTGTGGATGGFTGTGGATGGVPGGGGDPGVGGQVSSGGSDGTGAMGSGGASGGSDGTGGGDGTGGTGGTGGGSGGKAPADPSTGCGNANPSVGSSGSPLNVSGHQYYVKLPTNYDPSKPYPMLFVFNPTGNPISWAEQNAGYEKNGAKDAAIRVYPHPANSSSGWGAGDVSFFGPLYNKVTADYCVDRARVFAAGESSGGDFSSILGCEHADKVRAIAPCATKNVGQYPLNNNSRQCTGQVTAIIIHGKNDSVVGTANGPLTRDFYATENNCGTATEPVQGYTDSLSNCVKYTGCDEGYPVYWCLHSDPNYGGTNHGWPAFAANMSWGVFSEY